MNKALEKFRTTLASGYLRLSALSDKAAAVSPAPGKWSPKQVIGHLIDSAANNHQRFVRANFKDDLVFDGYDQERWVEFHDYQKMPWQELLDLWRGYNLLIARVMENSSNEALKTPRVKHNLYQTALVPVPADRPATLEYFMLDYIKHLERHLRQIAGSQI
jgi:hypothetical protein